MLYALSFIANVVITFSVANAIRQNAAGIEAAFGVDKPARRILACVYAAIGAASLVGLAMIVLGWPETATAIGLTLFPLQIIYKLLTAVAIGLNNVVVRANLGVVALLLLTLAFGT